VLLEREEPLALLEDALARARQGHGHTFLVGGEAGIGKTSLLEHFAAERAGNARVLWGACEALATPRPLGPLADIAEELKGPLRDALRSLRTPHELFQVFLNELRERDGPTVVVVEDAHWLDDASADFLKFVARRIARYPVLLAVTYRDEEVSPRHSLMRAIADVPADHLTRLALRRLSPANPFRRTCEIFSDTPCTWPRWAASTPMRSRSEDSAVPASWRSSMTTGAARIERYTR
jgi:predicted ATPase